MYLNQFKIYTGNQLDIATLKFIRTDEKLAEMFYEDGFRYYLKDERGLLSIIKESLGDYLQELPLPVSDIDTVFFISDNNYIPECGPNDYNHFIAFRNGLYNILAENKLNKAFPYIIGGAGCANLSNALRLADGLLRSENIRNILVIIVDKFEDDNKRLMPLTQTNRIAAGSIGSDIAAGFILSSRATGTAYLHIKNYWETAHTKMISSYYEMVRQGKQTNYMLETVKGLMHFKQSSGKIFQKGLNEYKTIYTGNYTKNYFKIYTQQFGWTPEKINMSSKESIGHAQSLDSLIAISENKITDEDSLIFLIGPCMWSVIEFNYSSLENQLTNEKKQSRHKRFSSGKSVQHC